MPFRSKAQQRLFFAKNPEKAQEWAKETKSIKSLPEKKHPQVNPKREKIPTKIASDGMFFQKAAQPEGGRFFRDLPGRDDGNYHEKVAIYSYAPGEIPSGAGANVSPKYGAGSPPKPQTIEPQTDSVDVGSMGAPVGGHGFRGEGMSGGMYGTGDGDTSEDEEVMRLASLLAAAVKGEERPAESGEEKKAARTPTDIDTESGIPTGFHRPAYEQPEALEPGGDRFHSTEATGPDYGAGKGFSMSTTRQAKQRTAPTSSGQMGKHASASELPRFLGTKYAMVKHADAGQYLTERGSDFTSSLRRAAGGVGSRLDEAAKGISQSPLASTLLLGFGLKGLGRGAGKLVRGATKGIGAKGAARKATKARIAAKMTGKANTPASIAAARLKGGGSNLISGISGAARKLIGNITK